MKAFPLRSARCMALASVLLLAFALPPARAADPEEAQYNVVVTLYNAGQWQAALKKIAERESQPLPDAMRARYLQARGMALEKGGRTADARAAYQALVDKYPQSPEAQRAQLSLLYLDYAARNFDGVLARQAKLQTAGLAPAERQQVALMQAESLANKKEAKSAVAAYQAALALGADKALVAPRLFALYYQLHLHADLIQLTAAPVPGVPPNLLALVRAESLLALNRWKEAEAEAQKIPAGSEEAPRAALVAAQALIKQGKLKEAAAPLELAVAKLVDLPPATHLALAECLFDSGRPDDARKAVAAALAGANRLPDAERTALETQCALLDIRAALEAKDSPRLIRLIEDNRRRLPADKLPEILYLRLFALNQNHDTSAILRAFKEDAAAFRGSPQEGAAVLIFGAALKQSGQADAAVSLLNEFVGRKPSAPESLGARLELAQAALRKDDLAGARELMKGILAAPDAAARLGADVLANLRYNYAAAALKAGDLEDARRTLDALLQAKPPEALAASGWVLLGQVQAQKNDFKNAAASWQKALALGKDIDRDDVSDRLGRALYAAGNAAAARDQFDALAGRAGGPAKLKRETRETWARSLYALNDFAGATKRYEELFDSFRDAPAYAYEAAVCAERAGDLAAAEKHYDAAARAKDRLSPEYAQAVELNLSRVRLQSGRGDLALNTWLGQLAPAMPETTFAFAVGALLRIAPSLKNRADALTGLEKALTAYPPETNRHYSVGAVLLHVLAESDKRDELTALADRLTGEFKINEKGLGGQGWGATVAPAMIYYYKGEAERRAGNAAEALVWYETVLAAYPYNEWPDAAACGAAECYLALGDSATAMSKWTEVTQSGSRNPASARWMELAKKRMAETQNGGR